MEEKLTITSENLEASFLSFGAELCSVKNKESNKEFIWQADKNIWARHAPVLFPFVGRLNNFEYLFCGKFYKIEQHGFARDMQFEVVFKQNDSVTFELLKNDYTYSRYPFDFSLRITYKLNKNKLNMEFEISNKNNQIMPVSFGGHPAFNITAANDAVIEFENDKNVESMQLLGNFLSFKTRSAIDKNGNIIFDNNTFDKDALMFKNLKSNWVKLKSKSSKSYIKVNINGWKYLGIWAKPGANFICIEPWEGIADKLNFRNDVSVKEGIVNMKPFEILRKYFEMEFYD